MPGRGKQQLESMLSLLIILAVMLVFYFYIGKIAVATEKSKVEYDLANMRSALHIYELSQIIASGRESLQQYAGANPMHIVKKITALPPNYIGEFDSDENLPEGSWFFDLGTGNMMYKIINDSAFMAEGQYLLFRMVYVNGSGRKSGVGRLKLLPYQAVKDMEQAVYSQ